MSYREDSALGAERVDPESEARFADEAAERWQESKRERAQQLRRRREALPLAERLAAVLRAAGQLPTAKAGAIASLPSGGPSSSAPPRADHLELGHLPALRLAEHLRLIELHIAELERALDAHLFGAHERELSTLPTELKDKALITKYEGLSPESVAGITDAFGSPRVIARVRKQHGRDPQTGRRE